MFLIQGGVETVDPDRSSGFIASLGLPGTSLKENNQKTTSARKPLKLPNGPVVNAAGQTPSSLVSYRKDTTSMFDKPLLLDNDVAEITGVSVSSVRKWRRQNRGPRFMRLGNSVRYAEEDVIRYVKSGRLYSETGIKSKRSIKVEREKRKRSVIGADPRAVAE